MLQLGNSLCSPPVVDDDQQYAQLTGSGKTRFVQKQAMEMTGYGKHGKP
jgi:hypothetical protein